MVKKLQNLNTKKTTFLNNFFSKYEFLYARLFGEVKNFQSYIFCVCNIYTTVNKMRKS